MGAHHFLDLEPLPDALRQGVFHTLELFETGGELYIKATLAAPTGSEQAYYEDQTPYTTPITASLRVTPAQITRIEQALTNLRARIGA